MTTRKAAAKATTEPTVELVINDKKVTDLTKIKFRENPKRKNSAAWSRYEKYQTAQTIGEYLKINEAKFAKADLRHDLSKEFLTIIE